MGEDLGKEAEPQSLGLILVVLGFLLPLFERPAGVGLGDFWGGKKGFFGFKLRRFGQSCKHLAVVLRKAEKRE